MMGICAPFYKRITGEQVRCREAEGQAAKVTVVSGPTNNLILRWAECPLLRVKRTFNFELLLRLHFCSGAHRGDANQRDRLVALAAWLERRGFPSLDFVRGSVGAVRFFRPLCQFNRLSDTVPSSL